MSTCAFASADQISRVLLFLLLLLSYDTFEKRCYPGNVWDLNSPHPPSSHIHHQNWKDQANVFCATSEVGADLLRLIAVTWEDGNFSACTSPEGQCSQCCRCYCYVDTPPSERATNAATLITHCDYFNQQPALQPPWEKRQWQSPPFIKLYLPHTSIVGIPWTVLKIFFYEGRREPLISRRAEELLVQQQTEEDSL